MGSIRRIRELSDIAPQYIAKSGLNNASELDTSKWGSIKIQHAAKLSNASEGKSRFPKLDECAHFHYEHVEIGPLQVSIADDENLKPFFNESEEDKWWSLSVESQGKTWLMRRSYDNFRMLDQQLHRCIYDRKFSELIELPAECIADKENIHKLLSDYMKRFSVIAGNLINCGPILNWLELDNRGHRLLVPDDNCPINTPAVAAAYSVKRYTAQAPDEISFEVGDMISVIDMPPPEESIWWHGKKGFQVGFFPCECVAVIGDKVPRTLQLSSLSSQPTKPVLRKHGKLIAFFRSFILSRPSRRRLKQSGILKERVFGCDLGEHLQNSGHEIPMILKCCVEFIESHGLVDGIYRLSGITSNIQKLRNAFDEDRVPGLYEDEAILQDVHSVASLLKMYFRELPNPLCTYQLYHQFVGAVQATQGDDTRLLKMRDVVQKLPPPHYRTLEYLMRHLTRVSEKGHETGMTSRNIAIVWAPNLLRCKELEIGGVAALQGVGVQAVVTEFLICYAELIFCDRLPNFSLPMKQVSAKKCRPKSLAISTPTKLLSLEEARNRALLQASGKTDQAYIEVGGGPSSLPVKYHTVIELPGYSRKRMGSKRSPLGWKLLFGKSGRNSQRKLTENKSSISTEITIPGKAITEMDLVQSRRHLRPAKSAESLSSGFNSETLDMRETFSRKGKGSNVEDTLHPILLRTCEGKSNGHNRSVSHESYFDHLQNQQENLDISEIEVNFDLEESEMRIFSEDETIMSAGSGSLASNDSPRILSCQKSSKGNSVKRLSYPKLISTEDRYDNTQNADPSPKKQKTNDQDPQRSKLEEQLSSSVKDIQFIDSTSPDQSHDQESVHLIQSSSPISLTSQISSSLLVPSSPILPHIPHLVKSISDKIEQPDPNISPSTDCLSIDYNYSSKLDKSEDDSVLSTIKSSRSHSTGISEIESYYLISPDAGGTQILEEVNISDKESLQSSELTTPDTPICSTYMPLLNFDEPCLSNHSSEDDDLKESVTKSPSKNLNSTDEKYCLNVSESREIQNEVDQSCEKIANREDISFANKSHRESITLDMLKIDKLKSEAARPKPEERKPKPVHPYVNVPLVHSGCEAGKILETSFDGEPITFNRSLDLNGIKYEKILRESSSDSLINFDTNKKEDLLTTLRSEKSSKVENEDSEKFDPEEGSTNFLFEENFKKLNENEINNSGKSICDATQDQSFFKIFIDNLSQNSEGNLDTSWILNDKTQMEEMTCSDIFEDFVIADNDAITVPCEKEMKGADDSIIDLLKETNEEEKRMSSEMKNPPKKDDEEKNIEEFSIDKAVKEENEKTIDVENVQNDKKIFDCGNTLNYTSNPNEEVKGLLETDLDMLEDDFELENVKEPVKSITPESEEFCCANASVRQLLSKFEPDSVKTLGDSYNGEQPDSVENSGKDTVFDKATPQKNKKRNEERPKTLERLSTRRSLEKDSVHESAGKVQLGKSKSGSQINEKSTDAEKIDILLGIDFDLSDPQRRERIEKYKEKRRNYLREKYRSESLKNEKDDFVLKIKQRHLKRPEWGEIMDGREGTSSCPAEDKRSSDKSGKTQISPKFRMSKDLSLKESGRKSMEVEDSRRSQCDQLVLLSKDQNQKIIYDGSSGKSERKSLIEQKSFKVLPGKKNHFMNFSSAGSMKEDSQGPGPSFKKQTSPHRGFTESKISIFSSDSKKKSEDCLKNDSQAPLICIKDMAAMFEERVNDAKTAKQYLSSV